jgi:hypothetical protein
MINFDFSLLQLKRYIESGSSNQNEIYPTTYHIDYRQCNQLSDLGEKTYGPSILHLLYSLCLFRMVEEGILLMYHTQDFIKIRKWFGTDITSALCVQVIL